MFNIFTEPFALWDVFLKMMGVIILLGVFSIILKAFLFSKLSKKFSEKEVQLILNEDDEESDKKIESVDGKKLKKSIDLLTVLMFIVLFVMLVILSLQLIF
jgi:cbb3-type cytochrome oxidase subunit 3